MTTLLTPSRFRTAGRRSLDLVGLLRLDAALCAATGAVAVAAAAAVAELLGPDVPTDAVRVVGLALLVWAVDVALLARASGRLLRRGTVGVVAVDLGWVLATIALVTAGAFSVAGAALALAVAAVVGGLGLLQLRAVRG